MLVHFFLPYVCLLSNAAWSVQQNLEGAGRLSSSVPRRDPLGRALGSNWDPQASVYLLLGLLCILVILGCLFVVLAGYVLGRRTGAVVTLVALSSPGLLSLAGFWPRIPLAPQSFEIDGAGVTGDVQGMLSLVILAVIAGWSATILIVDSLAIRRKFWDAFDHFWLVLGLLAAIFFVADTQVAQHDRSYHEAERATQGAKAYLLRQIETYDQWCRQALQGGHVSCRWASDVHQMLLDDSVYGLGLFANLSPRSSAEMYGRFGRPAGIAEMAAIRAEISAYNQASCPVKRLKEQIQLLTSPSPRCQITPPTFCSAFPDLLAGKMDEDLPVKSLALATECVVPTLIVLRRHAEQLAYQIKSDHQNRNYRWMYYLFFTAVLGAKLAGATTKLVSMDDRPAHETRRGLRLVCRFGVLGRNVLRRVAVAAARFFIR